MTNEEKKQEEFRKLLQNLRAQATKDEESISRLITYFETLFNLRMPVDEKCEERILWKREGFREVVMHLLMMRQEKQETTKSPSGIKY